MVVAKGYAICNLPSFSKYKEKVPLLEYSSPSKKNFLILILFCKKAGKFK